MDTINAQVTKPASWLKIITQTLLLSVAVIGSVLAFCYLVLLILVALIPPLNSPQLICEQLTTRYGINASSCADLRIPLVVPDSDTIFGTAEALQGDRLVEVTLVHRGGEYLLFEGAEELLRRASAGEEGAYR